MSISEKDAVLRERAAYVEAWLELERRARVQSGDSVHAIAAARYPLPKVPRPRVVTWGGAQFKMAGDLPVAAVLCKPSDDHAWYSDTFTRYEWDFRTNPTLLRKLADLIDNPTEEVEA